MGILNFRNVDEVTDGAEAVGTFLETPGGAILFVLCAKTSISEVNGQEVGLNVAVSMLWEDVLSSHADDDAKFDLVADFVKMGWQMQGLFIENDGARGFVKPHLAAVLFSYLAIVVGNSVDAFLVD